MMPPDVPGAGTADPSQALGKLRVLGGQVQWGDQEQTLTTSELTLAVKEHPQSTGQNRMVG